MYTVYVVVSNLSIGKDKGNQIQAWTGPEVVRTLRIQEFKKISYQLYAPAAFTPQEILLVLVSVRG
jgi:hypothetical protein